jgi:hypothetical protein
MVRLAVETNSSARSWRFSVTLKKNRRAVALMTVAILVPKRGWQERWVRASVARLCLAPSPRYRSRDCLTSQG